MLWDLPNGKADVAAIRALEKKYGMKSGSINPNLFQSAEYKYGSIANPSAEVRGMALKHLLDSVEIGRELGSKDVSLWIADGSNYPGTQSIRKRIGWMEEVLGATHAALGDGQRMLIEYKPFEPAFLSHRYCGLGDGARACAPVRAEGEGAGGYGTSCVGGKYRADRDVAAACKGAGRVSLQRSEVCGR